MQIVGARVNVRECRWVSVCCEGVPFTDMMCIRTDDKGMASLSITRSLVDLDGPLFQVFCEATRHPAGESGSL